MVYIRFDETLPPNEGDEGLYRRERSRVRAGHGLQGGLCESAQSVEADWWRRMVDRGSFWTWKAALGIGEMKTVINRHGLDLEALNSSRLPTSGSQGMDFTSGQYVGSSQAVAVSKDSKEGLAQNEIPKFDPFSSSRPPIGPSIAGHEYYQGVGTHRGSKSFDHGSPSSLDTRSANSQSQDKQMTQNDNKKAKTSRPANYNMVPSSGQMENFPSSPGNMRSMHRSRQDGQNVTENLVDSTNMQETRKEEDEIDRVLLWKKARQMKK
ncbi:chromatin structure-remodeling complex protein SYD-like [Hibiscus syriacus]|uniref:chromatin structure-remodeling complex protein SYD-like n=1 Tax=Hibiscus syriacus TaxID=106335 RepID=UPI001924AB76|nr:chromatin structure-remodeling complex protein SYD-like [Hibiscus syriacus]